MPEGANAGTLPVIDRDRDPYAWALAQAEAIGAAPFRNGGIDAGGLREFLEESADEMLAGARSQIVNLMAHAAKVALTRNPDVIGHWRGECTEFHDKLIDAYRPSMREKIDMDALWRRACRKVEASFLDHGESPPRLAADCPFALERLIDPDLSLDSLVNILSASA